MSSTAPATTTFIALAVGFFFITGMGDFNSEVLQTLAHWNFAVADGEWWRIFTPVLLHASLVHIMFNMWALWILGPQIERGVGTLPFIGLYMAAAGVGGVFVFYTGSPGDVAVGASGAIFGLFGVWFNWALRRRNTMHGQAILRQIGFLLLINAAIPFIVPGIAWEAHLGGLIAGFVIGEVWSRISGPRTNSLRAMVAFGVAVLAAIAVIL
jgi:rhomboid protease GluP